MYLKDKAKIISSYIKDSRNTQAVLINGEWGSGKTYFVDKILLKELSDYIVIRYSLYGVQSSGQVASDLQREMLIELIKDKKFAKKIKFSPKILDLAPGVIDIALKKFDIEADALEGIIDNIDYDKSRFIIVFDDLERSGMDINEVLGIINSYVECKKIKVIIIANEKEIGSSRVSSNLPQKYLIASNPAIMLEEKSDKKDKETYNLTELIDRTKKLFSNDIIYDSIKEKLIGLTVKISVDFHQIYDEIIKENTTESKEFLLNNKDYVIEILQDLECQNIRTLIFGVISYDEIYKVINSLKDADKEDYNMVLEEELHRVMRSVIAKSIVYKSGEMNRTSNDKYSLLLYYIKEYAFVDKYICYHELDKEEKCSEINMEIVKKLAKKREELEKDSLSYYKINTFGWLDYSDEEVIKLSDDLYDELTQERYDVGFFKDIIIYLIQLEYNFKEKKERLKHTDDEYIEVMRQYIINHDVVTYQAGMFEMFTDENELDEKYNSYVSPLIKATKQKENASTTDEIKSIFESEKWAESFYQYCHDKRETFMHSHSFLSSFEMTIIERKLSSAKNAEIREFSRAVCSVYDFSNIRDFYKADISNLELIIHILDEKYKDENTDCTTKIVIKKYKEKLIRKLDLLK